VTNRGQDLPRTTSRFAGRWDDRRRYASLASGVLLASALGYIALVDPHNPAAIFPLCPFRLLTGWNCPACGGLRMTYDVLHGDLAAAVHDNVFLLVGIPVLAGWVLLRRRRNKSVLPMPALATILITTLVWTVVRNLPGFPLIPSVLTS
jgi:hypothetical protein